MRFNLAFYRKNEIFERIGSDDKGYWVIILSIIIKAQ